MQHGHISEITQRVEKLGRVIAAMMGAFAEMPPKSMKFLVMGIDLFLTPGTYAIAGLISFALANEQCSFLSWASEAKGMFTQRLYRSLGLAAHLSWAHLLLICYRDSVKAPSSTRGYPGGRHHHFTPDDEDALKYERELSRP